MPFQRVGDVMTVKPGLLRNPHPHELYHLTNRRRDQRWVVYRPHDGGVNNIGFYRGILQSIGDLTF